MSRIIRQPQWRNPKYTLIIRLDVDQGGVQ